MKDLNGAFPRTPEAVEDAIHEGIRRGRRRELRRARLRRAACVAAVVAVMVGAFSLALNRDQMCIRDRLPCLSFYIPVAAAASIPVW